MRKRLRTHRHQTSQTLGQIAEENIVFESPAIVFFHFYPDPTPQVERKNRFWAAANQMVPSNHHPGSTLTGVVPANSCMTGSPTAHPPSGGR